MIKSLEDKLIDQNSSIADALSKIESNAMNMVVVHDQRGVVLGVATDGDIRRSLLAGVSIHECVSICMNRDFVWQYSDISREILIKMLDNNIRAIPLLSENGNLVDLVSRNHSLELQEGPVYVRARSPVRVSFGGGGSDLTHFFAKDKGGAVINATISLYTHASLKRRVDDKVILRSLDLAEELELDDVSCLSDTSGPFGLVKALLHSIRLGFGFELSWHSDYPIKSGLGGSSAMLTAALGCFNQLRMDRWDRYELAETAYRAERHLMEISGGWQDQYATVFGGFNFMEFKMDQNVIHPLKLHSDITSELEECLVLCDTGISHESGAIHIDQRSKMKSAEVHDLVMQNVDLCYLMRDQLLRGRLTEFGYSLNEAWELKRQFSSQISSPHLDAIYKGAMANGSIGGKLLGAGGGGFFLFFVPHQSRHQLVGFLSEKGLNVRPFRFEPDGLYAWTVRDNGPDTESR